MGKRREWTNKEIETATRMKNEGKSNKEIGDKLNRNPTVVYNKLIKIGICKRVNNKKHIYDIGETVNTSLKIIEHIRVQDGEYSCRGYKVQSINYPEEPIYEVNESVLKRGVGCAYTSGHRATEKNNLWNIEKIRGNITNVDEAKHTTPYSGKKILFKCSTKNCDNTKMVVVSSIVKHGFSCQNCSSNISYPERFMLAINKIYSLGYEYQVTYKDGRFDFINHDTKIIVEMNGKQHYQKENIWTEQAYKKTQISDNKKREWARENGYTLIFIDARKSDFNFIKDNINKESLLPNVLLKDEKDIIKMIESSSKYDIEKIIELYIVDELSTYEIGEKYNRSSTTISSILKRNKIKLRK